MNLSKLSKLLSPPNIGDGAVEFVRHHYDPYQTFNAPEYEEFLAAVKGGKTIAASAKYQKIYPGSSVAECRFAAMLARQLIP